ncbi:hypothetical protein J7L48_07860, partial [bacterium]|nr:hypothetical protein [bacterium]
IVENIINEHSKEMSLGEIRKHVNDEIISMEGKLKKYQSVVDKILNKLQIVMTEFDDIHIEVSSGANSKNIKELMVKDQIKELVTKYSGFDESKIFIGGELNSKDLIDCSIIVSPFKIENEVAGTLGILGNKTMFYDFNIDFVKNISKIISNILTDRYRDWR